MLRSHRIVCSALLGAGLVLCCSIQAMGAEFAVTPRVWFSNITEAENYGAGRAFSYNALSVSFVGATFGFKPGQFESTDFLLSYFTGTGDEEGTETWSPWGTALNVDVDRSDLELLVRHQMGDEGAWNVVWGARYVTFDMVNDSSMDDAAWYEENIPTYLYKVDYTILLGEVGIGFARPVSNGTLFANVVFGVGNMDGNVRNAAPGFDLDESDSMTSFDLNIGYQHRLSDNIALDLRWRNFQTTAGDADVSIRGPELGVTISI